MTRLNGDRVGETDAFLAASCGCGGFHEPDGSPSFWVAFIKDLIKSKRNILRKDCNFGEVKLAIPYPLFSEYKIFSIT